MSKVRATLTLDVREDAGIRPGYKLKLNSYDLGVDIELHDALQRIRLNTRGGSGCDHRCAQPHFLLRREYIHARNFQSRLESQLLQIHE